MKKIILLCPFLIISIGVWAQSNPVKIVFDITSKDEATHQAALRHVTMMSTSYPDSEFEVVVYAGAYPMVLKASSAVAEEIQQFEGNERVTFVVCEATLKRHQINPSQLLAGVKTVPDGILEIVTKQGEGWGYIKEAHH
ncbi:DsrE family protein [Cyclobacterium jeungdonense]|uniref:DsrE family protein n=1 Tax=Cyclobacterium jeungdonense TaxID=708087 RepID=A0ABT8CEN5_9BACT|nr:DsrE family protein [Cyclobacterium jeungdonense]MDN3690243.1 DsrE family protein [Cyclobacterium jeungdonense]